MPPVNQPKPKPDITLIDVPDDHVMDDAECDAVADRMLDALFAQHARTASAEEFYSEDQPRDEHGRFGEGGGPHIETVDASEYTTTSVLAAIDRSRGFPKLQGLVTYDKNRGTLENVWVAKFAQRQGIATALVKAADKAAGVQLKDTGERTREGEALLKAMGRPLAPLRERLTGTQMGLLANAVQQDLLDAETASAEEFYSEDQPRTPDGRFGETDKMTTGESAVERWRRERAQAEAERKARVAQHQAATEAVPKERTDDIARRLPVRSVPVDNVPRHSETPVAARIIGERAEWRPQIERVPGHGAKQFTAAEAHPTPEKAALALERWLAGYGVAVTGWQGGGAVTVNAQLELPPESA